jgi:hypothetical protein
VPFSGGKDSSFVLYTLKKSGLNPLAFNFNNHFQSQIGLENMQSVLQVLDVDMISYTPKWETYKQLCLQGLEINGDFCWGCSTACHTMSIRVALELGIKLVVFGESTVEHKEGFDFGDPFEKILRYGVQDGIFEYKFSNVTKEDIEPYTLPENYKDLKIIFLGDYIEWDVGNITRIIKRMLGWEGLKDVFNKNEHIDCKFAPVREYIKFIKRGYGRNTQLASEKLRSKEITRSKALEIAKKDSEKPKELREFLNALELSESEFKKTVNKHKVF